MVLGLSRPAACGVFPDLGSSPSPLHWQVDSLPLSHQGRPQLSPHSPVGHAFSNLLVFAVPLPDMFFLCFLPSYPRGHPFQWKPSSPKTESGTYTMMPHGSHFHVAMDSQGHHNPHDPDRKSKTPKGPHAW